VANARKKLIEKSLDLIVLNHPSSGLGLNEIQATFLDASGKEVLENLPKAAFAEKLLDRLEKLFISK